MSKSDRRLLILSQKFHLFVTINSYLKPIVSTVNNEAEVILMATNGEFYYLIGKPNQLKHELLHSLNKLTKNERSIVIPKTITTNEQHKDDNNYSYVEESDFMLRKNMGLYCLDWEKKESSYGISGEVSQLINKGINVFVNGSLLNIEHAMKLFPTINVVMIRNENTNSDSDSDGYPLVESENARLEWMRHANGVYCPFVLTIINKYELDEVASLLMNFAIFEHSQLAKAV